MGGLLLLTGVGIGYSALQSAIDMTNVTQPLFMSLNEAYTPMDINGGMDLSTANHAQTQGVLPDSSTSSPPSLLTAPQPSTVVSLQYQWIEWLQSLDSDVTKSAALTVSGFSVVAKEILFRYTL